MILANGQLYEHSEQDRILACLEQRINATRSASPLRTETVVDALDRMSRQIDYGAFRSSIPPDLMDSVSIATRILRRDMLTLKLRTELGSWGIGIRHSD